MTTERALRMVESAPTYYEASQVFTGIQQAIADDLDRVKSGNDDLALQLRATTATWGLKFWEVRVGLPVDVASSYETRRKKVLARIRSKAPFSAAMIKAVAEAYLDNPVTVQFDRENMAVIIVMDRETTVSPQLFAAVDNIIHAHLGVEYRASWTYASELQYSWNYSYISYRFQAFASQTLYAGTKYSGPAVVNIPPNPVYDGGRGFQESGGITEKTLQTPYKITGLVYAGTSAATIPATVKPADQSVTYNGVNDSLEAGQAYSATAKAYMPAGTTNAGTGVII